MNGVLLVNKPSGFTSFDVIAKLRGILRIKKLGHAGTLDPIATGVLPVFVGKATRACDIIPNNEKSYTAGFLLGATSKTQDSTGEILTKSDKKVLKQDIDKVVKDFVGNIQQIPPMYSAVSVGGKRLYDLARQGIEVKREAREIFIKEISVLDFDEKSQTGKLFIACSKGTYIRTIINDIGQNLGVGGIMTSLVRNSSSGFKLKDCLGLDEISSLKEEGKLEEKIIPTQKVFEVYPKIILDEVQTKMYKNCVKLDSKRVTLDTNSKNHRVFGFDGEFLGIGKYKEEISELAVLKNFF